MARFERAFLGGPARLTAQRFRIASASFWRPSGVNVPFLAVPFFATTIDLIFSGRLDISLWGGLFNSLDLAQSDKCPINSRLLFLQLRDDALYAVRHVLILLPTVV